MIINKITPSIELYTVKFGHCSTQWKFKVFKSTNKITCPVPPCLFPNHKYESILIPIVNHFVFLKTTIDKQTNNTDVLTKTLLILYFILIC